MMMMMIVIVCRGGKLNGTWRCKYNAEVTVKWKIQKKVNHIIRRKR
jgi:hypothetical protein